MLLSPDNCVSVESMVLLLMMMLKTITFLIIRQLLVATPCTGAVTLNSDPREISGNECRPVEITCKVQNLQFLTWFRNSPMEIIMSYVYTSPVFPETIYNSSGVVIQVITAVQESDSLEFNATSVLTATTAVLDMLNVTSIHCGNRLNSQTVPVRLNVKAAPPPSFTCFIASSLNSLSVFVQWNSSYTSQYSVERYSVSVSRDPSFCSSDQITPSSASLYSCLELAQGRNYDFTVGAFSTCGNSVQESERNSFSVEPQVPQSLSEVSVEPTYNEDAELIRIRVHWREQSQSHISEVCAVQLNYTVALINSARVTVEESFVTSESCRSGLCSTIFDNFNSSLDYRISVETRNGLGRANSNVTSVTINGSLAVSLLLLDFDFESCFITAICISSETIGNCSIQYSLNPSQDDLSQPVQASLNSFVTLPLLEPNTVYFYVATVTINSSNTFQLLGNFSTEQFSQRLMITNVVLIAIGVVVLAIAIMLAVTLLLLEMVKKQGSCLSLILLVVGGILLMVCVALWIVVCAIVIPQNNTCDIQWQSNRDHLIISALIFSLLALLDLVTAAAFLGYAISSLNYQLLKTNNCSEKILKVIISRESTKTGKKSLPPKEPFEKENDVPKPTSHVALLQDEFPMRDFGPEDLQVRGAGGRFEVVEERPLFDEFVPQGKNISHRAQYLQKREEDHEKMKAALLGSAMPSEGGEVQEQQYSSLEHGAIKKSTNSKSETPKEEYSTLGHDKSNHPHKDTKLVKAGNHSTPVQEYSSLNRQGNGKRADKSGDHATKKTEGYSTINLLRSGQTQDSTASTQQETDKKKGSLAEEKQTSFNPDQQILTLFHVKANSCRAFYWKESITKAEALECLQKHNYNAIKAIKEVHQDCKKNVTKPPKIPPNFFKNTKAELSEAMKDFRTKRKGIAIAQHISTTGHSDEQLKNKEKFEQFMQEANIIRKKYGRRPLTDAEGYNFLVNNKFDSAKAMDIITFRSAVTQKFLKDVNEMRKKYRKDALGKREAYEYLVASDFDEEKALEAISREGSDLLTFFEKANVIRKEFHKIPLTEAEAYRYFENCEYDIDTALREVTTDAKKPDSLKQERGDEKLKMHEGHFEMPEHRDHPFRKH